MCPSLGAARSEDMINAISNAPSRVTAMSVDSMSMADCLDEVRERETAAALYDLSWNLIAIATDYAPGPRRVYSVDSRSRLRACC